VSEEYIYTQQPRVRIHPLIGPKLKRKWCVIDTNDENLLEKKKNLKDLKPFWTTIGTQTYNYRLSNAPVSTIHHRFNMTCTYSIILNSFLLVNMEENKE
jgi:hypothetical protein